MEKIWPLSLDVNTKLCPELNPNPDVHVNDLSSIYGAVPLKETVPGMDTV